MADGRKDVVVDAAGYRERRRETLEALALRSAEQACVRPASRSSSSRCPSIERRIVHLRLQDEPGRDDAERRRGALSLRRRPTPLLTDPGSALARRLLETPGLTAIRDPSRRAACISTRACAGAVRLARYEGPIVDVGSGGGAPGIPLAAALPDREVVLLEATRRKCDFLESLARLPERAGRVRPRRGAARRRYGVAVAKALAPPPVALEWCLPLVRPGGAAVLSSGRRRMPRRVARVAAQLGGGEPRGAARAPRGPQARPDAGRVSRAAPGMARKRPLA